MNVSELAERVIELAHRLERAEKDVAWKNRQIGRLLVRVTELEMRVRSVEARPTEPMPWPGENHYPYPNRPITWAVTRHPDQPNQAPTYADTATTYAMTDLPVPPPGAH